MFVFHIFNATLFVCYVHYIGPFGCFFPLTNMLVIFSICRLTTKRSSLLKVLFPQHICAGKVPLKKESFCVGA
jgi:hypothetical protein